MSDIDPSEDRPVHPSSARRFAGNALWTMSAEVAGKLASLVFAIVVANGLGARQYGFFTFAVSYIPLFLMFARWGLDLTVTREMSRDRSQVSRLFATGLRLRASLSLVSYAVAIALVPLLVQEGSARVALVVIGIGLFFDELASFQGTVFRSFERMSYYALQHFVNRLLTMALAVLALAVGGDLVIVAIAYALGSAGATAYGAVMMRRHFPRVSLRDSDGALIRSFLKEGFPLAVSALLGVALFRVDSILLQVIRGPVEVGLYGVAYRFLDSLLFVAYGLTGVALPAIARQGRGAASARTFDTTLALLLAFYVPVAIGALFASRWAVALLFDPEFTPSATAVPWLTAAGVTYSVAYLARVAVVSLGRSGHVAWIAGAALAVNLALNAFLIPALGFEGAAIATFVAQTVESLCLLVLYVRTNRGPRFGGPVAAVAAASVVMGVTLWAAGLRDFGAVVVGSLVYLAALAVAMGIFARRDTKTFISMMRSTTATTPEEDVASTPPRHPGEGDERPPS